MNKIVFDFERWTTPEYEAFRLATLSGERETANTLLSKLIVEWDHPTLAPNDPESFNKLSLRDIGQVIRTVNERGNAMLQGKDLDVSGFKLDATGWNWGDFNDYGQAVSKYNLEAMKGLLSKVITEWPFPFPVDEMETLNFEQFCRLNFAVQSAVKDAMQGE